MEAFPFNLNIMVTLKRSVRRETVCLASVRCDSSELRPISELS